MWLPERRYGFGHRSLYAVYCRPAYMVPWQPPAIADRHVRTYVTQARSRNHCCRGKAKIITYSEGGFVVTVIQHAMRMRHVILPSVAFLVIQYLINGMIFGKKIMKIKRVLIFSPSLSDKIPHSEKNSARYHMCT
jgi:hypothetical protein